MSQISQNLWGGWVGPQVLVNCPKWKRLFLFGGFPKSSARGLDPLLEDPTLLFIFPSYPSPICFLNHIRAASAQMFNRSEVVQCTYMIKQMLKMVNMKSLIQSDKTNVKHHNWWIESYSIRKHRISGSAACPSDSSKSLSYISLLSGFENDNWHLDIQIYV